MAAAETGASSSPELDDEDLSPGEAQARLQALQQVCQELTRKINELDMDRTEHGLVIDALKPLDPNRKCFRMVGDVVVERTISEVFPAVVKNRDAIILATALLCVYFIMCQCGIMPLAFTKKSHEDGFAVGASNEWVGENLLNEWLTIATIFFQFFTFPFLVWAH